MNGDGRLTERSLEILDTERLIARQGVLAGSEEHKELMRKTIRMIQDNGNFAFVTREKDSFDVGEIRSRKRNLWDLEDLTVYECQTNAIKEEIEKGVDRAKSLNARLIWVVGVDEVAEGIRDISGGDCVLV